MSAPANPSNLRRLVEDSPGRLLWRYSLPAVVGMLVMQLYNVVDRIFIGQVVGTDALAGLAITFPVMNVSAALGVLVGAGTAARVSILLGAGNPGGARMALGNALTLTFILGFSYILLFALFLNPVLELFGATDRTLPYARDYMVFILPGLLMTNLTYSFNNVMRASGFPTRAMVTMFVGAGVNVVLDPVFIYGFGWGIRGAAIASDVAMTVSMIFVMRHFLVAKSPVVFTRGTFRLRPDVVIPIIGVGAAPSIVNMASCMINILVNNSLLRHGGVEAIAASGIMVTYTAMLCCVVLGICQGMQPIVGYNFGAGRTDRLWRTFWLAVGASTAVTAAGCAAAFIAPGAIARAFVAEARMVSVVAHALTTAMVMFWMVGFQIVATTFFQSLGRVGSSIFLSLSRQVIFMIPLLIWLPSWLGLDGVWIAFPASDTAATAVTLVMILWLYRQIKPRHKTD